MPSIERSGERVTVGVDTHRDMHVAVALDANGGYLGQIRVEAADKGYRSIERFAAGFGSIEAFGIEGTGCYGAGLARYLARRGHALLEVDRPDRRMRRQCGKNDSVDAHAAALSVLSGRARNAPKSRDGEVEAIRALSVARRSAVRAKTQAINQIRGLVVSAPERLHESLKTLGPSDLLNTCASFRMVGGDPVTDSTKRALRTLARRVHALQGEVKELERHIEVLCRESAPQLLDVYGVGVQVAAALLNTVGDNPERLRSEASFAHLCGVAPIPASSGLITRHRLNRGGDRQANNALWRIVMVRMASDPRTKAYVERRTQEGLSKPEIIRCLKRYVAREVFHCLMGRSGA